LGETPAPYALTAQAVADLDEIWRYGAQTWSPDQADRYIDDLVRCFELIAAIPTIARERQEFTPPVRIHVHGQHLIIYRVTLGVEVIRILGGRQDWRRLLDTADD
jgi:toxin ParE1/3/4